MMDGNLYHKTNKFKFDRWLVEFGDEYSLRTF
jgi:hypothetical protein